MKKKVPRATSLLFTLAILCLVSITSCDGCKELATPDNPPSPPPTGYPTKPPTVLPAATQTGVGTLGCKINGRVWTFWIPPFALTDETSAQLSESNGSGTANIHARIWSSDTFVDQIRVHHNISFAFSNPTFEPQIINKAVADGFRADNEFRFYLLVGNQNKWYYPDTSAAVTTNRLIIDRVDTGLNIISGRFDLILYRRTDNDTTDFADSLVISEGRFDFKYDPQ
jgi:hypothetical protein